MSLEPGATAEVSLVVTSDRTADAMGDRGVHVLATLLETDGKRFLFAVEAWDDAEKVAEGRHERHLVADLAKFIARAMRKGQR